MKKRKSAFPKGFFKRKDGESIDESDEAESSKSEILKDDKSNHESMKDSQKPKTNKQIQEKEVKIRQESRSEKRKSRARQGRAQRQHNEVSDEESPECRLDSTPKRNNVKSKGSKQQSGKNKQSGSNKDTEKISSAVRKSKNVQFHKLNWGNVPRRIDCWQNIPVPAKQDGNDDSNEPSINQSPKQELKVPQKSREEVKITKIKQPDQKEDTRLIESLNQKGDELEIVEMNEDQIPYK